MTVRVRLLGRPRVEVGEGQPRPQPRGQKSWALLARAALTERAPSRAELSAELFSAADDPLAALRWSLADLRRALGLPGLLRGDPLTVPRGDLWLDVWALEDATLPDSDLGGVLLAGIDLRDAANFDMWLLIARSRCAVRTLEELRGRALQQLAAGSTAAAIRLAETAVGLDPLNESAHELLLRALVADGQSGLAQAHLAACEGTFAAEGLVVSPALRAAAQDRMGRPAAGVRAAVVAASLLQAGTAALDAGAADGGIETLRRAADDAARSGDPGLEAEVLRALGSALVHAVRGFDGEGAVVLHRALPAARAANHPAVAADILRELAFIDVQAGRHVSASRALREAKRESAGVDDRQLDAAILAVEGMNEADRGRHGVATALLTKSAALAVEADRPRQRVWSLGVLSRSLLLSGQLDQAHAAAESSLSGAQSQRWNAFVPWPQALRAECLAVADRWEEARDDAERAFALGCELGDPCWEGMAGRALSLVASHDGDHATAWSWILDARRRCDRVTDRYVWVSCYIGLAQLELADRMDRGLVPGLATRLYDDATRADLPEFAAWALVFQAPPGESAAIRMAQAAARDVDNPALHARLEELIG
jgi:tetratricopeptide (TPR) repeat protein